MLREAASFFVFTKCTPRQWQTSRVARPSREFDRSLRRGWQSRGHCSWPRFTEKTSEVAGHGGLRLGDGEGLGQRCPYLELELRAPRPPARCSLQLSACAVHHAACLPCSVQAVLAEGGRQGRRRSSVQGVGNTAPNPSPTNSQIMMSEPWVPYLRRECDDVHLRGLL